jgi:hypothetical protein
MQTNDRVKTQVTLDSDIDQKLRVISARHRGSTLSSIVEDCLRHCLDNRAFLDKLKAKHEKEPQF